MSSTTVAAPLSKAASTTQMVSSRKSESVRVALSIRPLLGHELGGGAEECLRISEPGKPEVVLTSDKCAPFPFAFDHVEDPRGDGIEGVFRECVKDKLLGNVFCGFNATVLAYGQTGSGKTHAMGCSARPNAPAGLIQLTVGALFEHMPEGAVARASFTQIYNEELQDLLCADREGLAPLELKRAGSKGWYAPEARREVVRSLDEVEAVLKRGCASRQVGETSKNALSSRSHAILTLELALPLPEGRGSDGGRGAGTLRPKVTFVDLAGSERTKDAGTSGAQQKEGTKINLSLFNLGSVINALGNKDAFVPYNRSALTKLLQDSLGGSAQTLMLACASPAAGDTWETLSTLYSVSRARLIVNKPTVTTSDEPALSADELVAQREEQMRGEIETLRAGLAAAEQRRLTAAADADAAQCAAVLERTLAGVEQAAAAEEAAALRTQLAAAETRRAAAAAAAEAAAASAAAAEAATAQALEATRKAAAENAELRAQLEQAWRQAGESADAATAADIRAKAVALKAATAEPPAQAAPPAPTAAPPGEEGAEAEEEEEETPARRAKQPRASRRTRGGGAAAVAPPTRASLPAQPLDARDYDAAKLDSGIEVQSVFVSKVDRFGGPTSMYGKPASPGRGHNKRALGEISVNAAQPAEAAGGRKRATRASARAATTHAEA